MSARSETLIFLHMPKTGGTSLRAVLLRSLGGRASIKLMNQDEAPLLAMSPEARAALGMVEGHMLYGVHERIPGPCVYITILREPAARLRSWYRYVRRNPKHRLHGVVVAGGGSGGSGGGGGGGLSLAECIERRLTPELDNDMTRTLASVGRSGAPIGGVTRTMFDLACERLASIEFVGTTERMDAFHAHLCARMGWEAKAVGHLNRTEAGALEPDPREDEGALRVIREANAFDLALWERAGVILERRLAAGG